jgi:hypothetical protein
MLCALTFGGASLMLEFEPIFIGVAGRVLVTGDREALTPNFSAFHAAFSLKQ